jgi:indolepyruvate ferredoxin oxidoreductase alpha subunit
VENKARLLTGDEAVALGAYEAGAEVGASYPGTPATEILETFARFPDVYAEWSVNEKVAFEVAYGASLAGMRAFASMKHVGLNVASDSFISASYTGVNAGLVVITADDPSLYSSQNEQDNRHYARLAKVPLLEPADSQEAKDLVKLAFELSEKFDTPVLLRLTTRLAHSYSVVSLGERFKPERKKYQKEPGKYLMLPANARERHKIVEERLARLKDFSQVFEGNRFFPGSNEALIISSGVAFSHAREAFPEYSFLKLSMTYPLPEKLIKEVASQFKEVWVVEELDPILEEEIRALGVKVTRGKDSFPLCGELNPDILRKASGLPLRKHFKVDLSLPLRPPVLCPGCPHRAVFYVLKKMGLTVLGDIGCYTLGALPPLESMDTCLAMGAGVGMLGGFLKAGKEKKVCAVIGDSTFLHAGLPALLNLSYNNGQALVIILDNQATAMTGGQNHPGTGLTAQGKQTKKASLEELSKACGAEKVFTVSAFSLKAISKAVEEALSLSGLSVLIVKGSCVLVSKPEGKSFYIDKERCDSCRFCLEAGCPALTLKGNQVEIEASFCTGCTVCVQICPKKAIRREND